MTSFWALPKKWSLMIFIINWISIPHINVLVLNYYLFNYIVWGKLSYHFFHHYQSTFFSPQNWDEKSKMVCRFSDCKYFYSKCYIFQLFSNIVHKYQNSKSRYNLLILHHKFGDKDVFMIFEDVYFVKKRVLLF